MLPRGAMVVSLAAVVAWAGLLPTMQVPVRNRTRYKSLLREGRTEEAVRELCGRERGEYRPVWSPPPRIEAGDRSMEGELPVIAAAISGEARVPEWVDEVYGEKMVRWCSRRVGRYGDSVTGPRRDRRFVEDSDHWTEPSEEARVDRRRRLEAAERVGVRTCLEFVRDRMTGLTERGRACVGLWIETGEKVEMEGEKK